MTDRRKFSKEYKLAAIQPLLDGEKSTSQQAEYLGIGRSSLPRWLEAYRADGGNAFPGSGRQTDMRAESAELRRRLREAEMERDILKTALSIFSREKQ